MWLVKRKTRRRVSSSTPNNLLAEIASVGLSPQRSSYYATKVSMHIRKEVPPAASPSTLEDVEGGNQYAVHGF